MTFMSNYTCVTLFWTKSSFYTSCIEPKLQERYNIRTGDETMRYTFIANSLYPLEIIFQLLKKYHWELNITSEINGECQTKVI